MAPVRALLQRLGPHAGLGARWWCAAADRLDLDELVPSWSRRGYRREHQVEHRGEIAVRGGIVDVFPSTADVPVRIDLWGDEVDRLTDFSVGDQRSSPTSTRPCSSAAGSCVLTPSWRAERRSL